MKKIITIALSIALILGCMLPAQDAKAYTGTYTPAKFKKSVTLCPRQAYEFDLGKKMRNATKIKVTSSNKKVVRDFGSSPAITMSGKKYYGYIFVVAQKRGSATLKIQLTYKGKKYKYTTRVKVVKYQNAVSIFKIGSTNYASKLKKTFSYNNLNITDKRVKVYVKPKKGWKITKMKFQNYNPVIRKTIKNNSYVTFGCDGAQIQVTLYNKKLNQYSRLWVMNELF